jgi:hypothetical protein
MKDIADKIRNRRTLDEAKDKALLAEWMVEAHKQTPKTIGRFVRKLVGRYKHDYGTIIYAVTAAAIGAANAVNHSDQGGITGFQAGAIMWTFIDEWMHEKGKPLQMIHYENMLYPQYREQFEKRVSFQTGEWIVKQARANLKSMKASPEVMKHWRMIAKGKLPWGYKTRPEME